MAKNNPSQSYKPILRIASKIIIELYNVNLITGYRQGGMEHTKNKEAYVKRCLEAPGGIRTKICDNGVCQEVTFYTNKPEKVIEYLEKYMKPEEHN